MRLTDILLKGEKIGMQFKTHWLVQRIRSVQRSPAESILLSQGIQVVDAKDVLRPALIEEPYIPLFSEEDLAPEEKKPCYVLDNTFKPLLKLEQAQLLTNSLTFNTFPEKILNKVQSLTKEDEEYFKDIILHSLLLDAEQRKLKRVGEFKKYPGYIAPREYGITPEKMISSLLYHLLLHLEQTNSNEELKNILQNVSSKITLNHGENLMHLNHNANFMVCSNTPMEPMMTLDEVKSLEDDPLPDLYPMSPFVHVKCHNHYNFKEGFGIKGGELAPHTVLMANKSRPFLVTPENFYAMTLVYAFSFAASYARESNKSLSGRLDKPVTLNIVHTNGRYFHTGIFQLNTLDCMDTVRNIFWHQPPWESLFEKIGFNCAKPSVDDVNAKPLALLKAIY